jgi:molybdate transport system permease protein
MDWQPLFLSLEVASIATVLATVLGVLLATVLTHPRLIGREFIDALMTLPLVMPPTVLGYYLLVTLGSQSVIGDWYQRATGDALLFSVKACVIAATIGSFPLIVKSARTALEDVDERVMAAAKTLGAGPVRAYVTVRLPLAARGIFAGVMLGFARALGDFGMTLMIGGDIPGKTRTAPLYIYSSWQGAKEVAMQGMVILLTAVAIAIMWAVNHLTKGRRVT